MKVLLILQTLYQLIALKLRLLLITQLRTLPVASYPVLSL
jgi:hypothetical protein